MNEDEFRKLRSQAVKLYDAQPARDKHKVSLDAVFTALAMAGQGEAAKVRKLTEEEPPEWFTETLERLRGTGERVTVARVLLLAGKFPATRSDSLSVGRWLREAGITPTKTGGNLIFQL